MSPHIFYYYVSREEEELLAQDPNVSNRTRTLFFDKDLKLIAGIISWLSSNSNPGASAQTIIRISTVNISTPEGVIQYSYTKTGTLPIVTKSSYTAGFCAQPVTIQRAILPGGVRQLTIT